MENILELLINNWAVVIGALALMVGVFSYLYNFLKAPRVIKLKRFRKWLLVIVIEAEKELGSKTGELKLLSAYERFVENYPILSLIFSFESFKLTVDEALIQMKKLLEDNEEIDKYIHEPSITDPVTEVECSMCTKPINKLDTHNGELMCSSCYELHKEEE